MHMLDAAKAAVAAACQVTRQVQSRLDTLLKLEKSDQSPVTIADYAAQAIIARVLTTHLGPLPLASEECSKMLETSPKVRDAVVQAVRSVWPDISEQEVITSIDAGTHDASSPSFWTLDPVDGTKGFIRGGQYAIALAYIEQGEVTLGVMGCPNLSADFSRPFSDPDPEGLIYFAGKNTGCWVVPSNGVTTTAKQLHLAPLPLDHKIRICESFDPSHSRQEKTALVLQAFGDPGTPVRLDSQCKYAVVARGQADAYLRIPTNSSYEENIWDHAAGMLIAQEAGAIVSDVRGKRLDFSKGQQLTDNRGLVCAAPQYHERIIMALQGTY
jgi:HAL2 family 3'(2'),5'-bisphosphate nucleotidase